MTSISYKILSIFLLFVGPFYIHEPKLAEETLKLNELDLSNHPNLYTIIDGIIQGGKTTNSNKVHFVTARLMNDSCGILMRIVLHTRSNLSWYDAYSGYTIIDNTPVIFINKSDMELRIVPEKQGIFPMEHRYAPPYVYDPDIWTYLLKNNSKEFIRLPGRSLDPASSP